MEILVADDEREVAEFLKEVLETQGHRVDLAFDGARALELMGHHPYALMFVDQNMPELTGLELVKYVKRNGLKTKTVIITGYPLMEDFFARSIGADEYLSKPFKLQDVERIVRKYGGLENE